MKENCKTTNGMLKLGHLELSSPFILAPLAGFTDKTMRALCEEQGAALTFTEMISGKGLRYGDRKTAKLLELTDSEEEAAQYETEKPVQGGAGFQIFGDDPEILHYAARELAGKQNLVLDLNCGCPVPKIVKNGEGSALLKRLDRLHDCVAAMVAGTQIGAGEKPENNDPPKPVTAKIRMGFARGDNVAAEAAKAIEAAGAAAVTVHGRTREQYYEGEADWNVIAEVKKAVRIPVIGNGDVHCGEDAIRMMHETGCDGVMIARGALGNPWIFREAAALWEAGWKPGMKPLQDIPEVSQEDRINMLIRHLRMVCEDKGERVAVKEMRKFVGHYTRGMRGAAAVRRQINTGEDAKTMIEIIRKL